MQFRFAITFSGRGTNHGEDWIVDMRAFVKYGAQPFQASLEEIDEPEPGPREVMLKVAGCGICGSDLHAYRAEAGYEWVKHPVVLGHEFTGTVMAIGTEVQRYQKGDRVAVIGIQGCGTCPACRNGDTNLCNKRKVIGLDMDGGMAEYAVVGDDYLIHVPNTVDLPMAAMAEPMSVAAHALSKTGLYPEQNVVITGSGPIGLFCGVIAKWSGARVLMVGTDQDARSRLPVARKIGLTTVNVNKDSLDETMRSLFGNLPADLWLEASGSPLAFKTALDKMRRGGSLVIVGMYTEEFMWSPTVAVRAGYSLHFSYASVYRDYRFALEFMASGKLNLETLVDLFPLEEAGKAFEAMVQGSTIKPILLT